MSFFSLTCKTLSKLFGLIVVFILIPVVTTQCQLRNRSRSRPATSPSPIADADADAGPQKFDDATKAILKSIQELNEREKQEHDSVEAMKKSVQEMRQKERAERDSAEAQKIKQTRVLSAVVAAIALILFLLVKSTVKRSPGEHNTPTLELFRFRKFRTSRKKMRRYRVASDWLFQKNALPYLLRIVGEHVIVFMIVVAVLFLLFSTTLLDVAILSCIEIFFAFVGAYYASLADRSSSMAYEKASLAMRSVMNFSDDLGGFVERLKLLVTRLTGEGKDFTMKFVTVIPAFGKVGLSLPEGESYYSRMQSQDTAYQTWDFFLKTVLEGNSRARSENSIGGASSGTPKEAIGRVKVKMLTHAADEREAWITNIMKASGLDDGTNSNAVKEQVKEQQQYLQTLTGISDGWFEYREWKTPSSNGHSNNAMPFQFVVIKMGIERDDASMSVKNKVHLERPGRKISSLLVWIGIFLGVTKALARNNVAPDKKVVSEKSLKPPQRHYDGSKLMFLFSGDYIYNNFLVDIEKYLNKPNGKQRGNIDLSMHEFVKFSKGYYSESAELIEFFDKLFDFLWTYSKTQKMAS
jgi:hypothetical protein